MRNALRFLLPIISGLLLTLPWIFPETGWILLVAFVPLLLSDYGLSASAPQNKVRNFSIPFTTFLVWNLLSSWWIGYVSFSGMMLIVILNALLMSGVWWLAKAVRIKSQAFTGFFALIVFWLAFEFLQHHWDIPWPWLSLGNGFANSVQMIQWYEYTGVLGGSFWILISNILIFRIVQCLFEKQYIKSIKIALSACVVIVFPLLWSLWLFSNYQEEGESLNVTVLQPNVDPYHEKFSDLSSADQINRIVTLAESIITDTTDLIIAPETALPNIWEDSLEMADGAVSNVSHFILKNPHVGFISGALTQRRFSDSETISETARLAANASFYYDIYNSALLFDSTGKVQVSHKTILVNGVERMPFQKYFSFLGDFVLNLGGTSGSLAAAQTPIVLSGKGTLRIGTIICFESAFGEFTSRMVAQGANLLVVLTNDGWWKDSPGAWQHFGYARLRAIECRRSVAQSANTGISGFINARGKVLKFTELNKVDALSAKVQLNDETTFYVRYGDFIGRICLVLSILVLIYVYAYRWFGKL